MMTIIGQYIKIAAATQMWDFQIYMRSAEMVTEVSEKYISA